MINFLSINKKRLNESIDDGGFEWVEDMSKKPLTLKLVYDSNVLEIGDIIVLSGPLYDSEKKKKIYTVFNNNSFKFTKRSSGENGILEFKWLQPIESRPEGWRVVSTGNLYITDESTINEIDGELIVNDIIKATKQIEESIDDDFEWAEDIVNNKTFKWGDIKKHLNSGDIILISGTMYDEGGNPMLDLNNEKFIFKGRSAIQWFEEIDKRPKDWEEISYPSGVIVMAQETAEFDDELDVQVIQKEDYPF